jgi:type IV pilus assembly protein PilA
MFNLAKLREERAKNGDEGFTLIELLVVVVIIGILIAIAIPLYLNYKKGAADKSAQSDLRNAISTLETCNSDNSVYPASITPNSANGACTNQQINTSSGTTLTYYVKSDNTAYLLLGVNSNGNVTGGTNGYYCYASAAGGSVVKKTTAQPTQYQGTC